ncbi:Ionotropic receptor 901 [Blattella germanica]|nr:Ionotropic receptor 901 [Blattella germanica]
MSRQQNLLNCLLNITERYYNTKEPIQLMTSSFWENGTNEDRTMITDIYLQFLHEPQNFPILSPIHYTKQVKLLPWRGLAGGIIVILNQDDLEDQIICLSILLFVSWKYMSLNKYTKVIVLTTYSSQNSESEEEFVLKLLRETWIFAKVYRLRRWSRFKNTIVLMSSNVSNHVDVFGWLPEKQSDRCIKELSTVTLLDTWIAENETFKYNNDLFPVKEYPGLRLCVLFYEVWGWQPYAYEETFWKNGEWHGVFLGPEIRVIKETAAASNFYVIMREGGETANFQAVEQGGIDIFGVSPLREYFMPSFDHSGVHYSETKAWHVPAGKPIPSWQGLLRIFNPQLWSLVISAHLLVSVVFWLLKKFGLETRAGDGSIIAACLYTLRMSLGISVPVKSNSRLFLALLSISLFYYLQVYTAYQSSLIGFMTHPGTLQAIKNLKELEMSGIELASALRYTHDFLPIGGSEYLGRNVSYFDKNTVNRLGCEGNLAVMASNTFVDFRASFTDEVHCKPRYQMLDDELESTYMVLYMTKGNLFFERIDDYITRMQSGGLIHKWFQEEMTKNSKIFINYTKRFSKLTIHHLQGAYYVYFTGLILSISTFMLEVFYYCSNKILKKMS